MAARPVLYFAYGSNLDPDRMRARCPGAVLVGRAALADYRLTFSGHTYSGGQGVATVTRKPGDRVRGLLYEVPAAELDRLDRCEGHPFCYRRKLLLVTDKTGRQRRAHTYVLPALTEALPEPWYLELIGRAYRRLGYDLAVLVRALPESEARAVSLSQDRRATG